MPLTLALHKARREHPERLAAVCGDRRLSFAALATEVAQMAGGLQAIGVRRGDRVALLAPNTDRFLVSAYAVWSLGAILTPLNCRWSADELAYALADSGAGVLLLDDAFAALLPALRERSGASFTVVALGEGGDAPAGGWRYAQLLGHGVQGAPAAPRACCCRTPACSAPRWPRSRSASAHPARSACMRCRCSTSVAWR
jgi:acyl-CoA synthetase (AMP-forming)/AMP-acid ligase II